MCLTRLDLQSSALSMWNVFLTEGYRGIGPKIKKSLVGGIHNVISLTRSEIDLTARGSDSKHLACSSFQIDILLNNAAETTIGSMNDIDIATWGRTFRVNLTSPFHRGEK